MTLAPKTSPGPTLVERVLDQRKGAVGMTRQRHTAEEIINKLRESEVGLARGLAVPEVCRKLSVTEQTYYRWRKEYGGLRADQAKRLRELEQDNARPKKLVAELSLGERTSADRCRLLLFAGNALGLSGDYDAAEGVISQAMALAQELEDQHLLGVVLFFKAEHHWLFMQYREAADAALRAVEPLRSASDLQVLVYALWTTAWASLHLGRLDEVAPIVEEAETLATRLGDFGALMMARRGRSLRELMVTGDLKRFEEFTKDELELAGSVGLGSISTSYTLVGLVDFWSGCWPEALERFQEAARLEPPEHSAGSDWGFLFLPTAYAPDKEAAMGMLDERKGHLPRSGRTNTLGAWTMLLAVVEGLAVLGEREEAAKLYPLVLEAIDTGTLIRWADVRLLQTVAGMAAAAGAQWEKAEEHYRTALRQAHEIPHKIEQPEVRRWYARMLLERDAPGDRDKAFRLLTEAIAMYRDIGMPKHVEMAEALLGEV